MRRCRDRPAPPMTPAGLARPCASPFWSGRPVLRPLAGTDAPLGRRRKFRPGITCAGTPESMTEPEARARGWACGQGSVGGTREEAVAGGPIQTVCLRAPRAEYQLPVRRLALAAGARRKVPKGGALVRPVDHQGRTRGATIISCCDELGGLFDTCFVARGLSLAHFDRLRPGLMRGSSERRESPHRGRTKRHEGDHCTANGGKDMQCKRGLARRPRAPPWLAFDSA